MEQDSLEGAAPPAGRGEKPVRYGAYPEFTWASVLVGYAIGVLIAVSIGYLSLKLGFSIEGSELAAILGFGVLRGLMRHNSIIENNINQTLASAVNGASAGMMFSVPALFILGITGFSYPAARAGVHRGRLARDRVHHPAAKADDRLQPPRLPRRNRHGGGAEIAGRRREEGVVAAGSRRP